MVDFGMRHKGLGHPQKGVFGKGLLFTSVFLVIFVLPFSSDIQLLLGSRKKDSIIKLWEEFRSILVQDTVTALGGLREELGDW